MRLRILRTRCVNAQRQAFQLRDDMADQELDILRVGLFPTVSQIQTTFKDEMQGTGGLPMVMQICFYRTKTSPMIEKSELQPHCAIGR
jgi:hypothetical protein